MCLSIYAKIKVNQYFKLHLINKCSMQKVLAAEFIETSFEESALHPCLWALWHDANQHWDQAHTYAQAKEGNFEYDRIHAYLHRKEGDVFNAKWWYKTIGLPYPTISLEQEWLQLFEEYSGKYPF
jgi:hypothetical protein